ncbi:MAG: matrixin family metalloprotease [Acidobacteriota bacterium]|nr:matrixin family metalloprotease [Acidobacteriota bacterium]
MSKIIRIILVLLWMGSFNFFVQGYQLQFADDTKSARLRWKTGKIPISLSTSLTKQNQSIESDSDIANTILKSLENWEKIANIKFEISWTDKQNVSPIGKVGDGISLITIAQTPENLLLFGDNSEEISARTRTFFNRRGLISEADIVLNPYQQFSIDGTIGTFDLESTITHEIGHLLGLEHSLVIGATMNAHQGKNGVYNLQSFSPRTLSEDDITGVRALYGANDAEQNCCGKVNGKLILSSGKPAKEFDVWLEDSSTNRIFGGVATDVNGSFNFEGLREGNYSVYAKQNGLSNKLFSAEKIADIEVIQGKSINLVKKLKNNSRDFNIQYIGFNGQLSLVPVTINSGNSYTIFVGGRNFNVKNIKVIFNSPNITVVPESYAAHNYGDKLSVISFEIRVDSKTVNGEYSFYVQNQNDSVDYVPGGLTVENYSNIWNSSLLPE